MGYVAGQAGVAPGEFASYDWSGRTVRNHRAQIRAALGFREQPARGHHRVGEPVADEEDPGVGRLETAHRAKHQDWDQRLAPGAGRHRHRGHGWDSGPSAGFVRFPPIQVCRTRI